MAGSYNHCVYQPGETDDLETPVPVTQDMVGKLRAPRELAGMLDYHDTGDVYEAVEEMYGMIQYLAEALSLPGRSAYDRPFWVETARQHYKVGLRAAGVKPWDEP